MRSRFAFLALGLALAGCASVQRQPLAYEPMARDAVGAGRTVLLFPVRESRPQVLLEGQPNSWIGDERVALAIPRQVLTGTGQPLAEVVGETVARDLEAAGFDVRLGDDVIPADRLAVGAAIRAAGADRGLFVDLLEFAVRAVTDVDVHWNLFAEVYAADGVVLAERRLEGFTTLDGSILRPGAVARESVPGVFLEVVRALVVDDAELMEALAR